MQPPGSWNTAAELVSCVAPARQKSGAVRTLSRAQTLSQAWWRPAPGQRGGGPPTAAPANRPFPTQPPGMRARAPARQAGPGRSSLRLSFVRDPAPAPHVGPEPGRVGGGFLGRPAGRIPGGPELSLCGNAARFILLALTSRGALPGPAP